MKVVILAGGLGTRISEESHWKPKPMITIGEQPILWHIMKIYSYYGFHDFVICCGYMGHVIKEYFANYYLYHTSVTFDLSKEPPMAVYGDIKEPWCVTLADTGLSKAKARMVDIFERNGIEYVLKKYYGNVTDQYFGGWIDNTLCRDLLEPDDFVTEQAAQCTQVRLENMHVFRGKLHRCSNSLFLSELGICVPNKGDYVDLRDGSSLDEKRAIIRRFYQYPRKSCHYCTWKSGSSAERFGAAEQMREGTRA